MNLLKSILLKIIPSRDEEIRELRIEINKLKYDNKNMHEKINRLKENSKIPIKFYDEDIENIIIRNIDEAKYEICVATAWFTSVELMNKLKSVMDRGVNVKIIISNAKENEKWIFKLKNSCNKLSKVIMKNKYSKMHNKYCIIDKDKVIDGSYNWTKNARNNLEHIIVIENEEVANMYKDNFNKIFNNRRYYANYDVYDNVI